jgi:hypothetical protein
MIGPVQLMIIGYDKPYIAEPLRTKVGELKADPAVRVIDVLCVHKTRDGNIEMDQISDLLPEHPHEPGSIISRLLTSARAARTMGKAAWTGPGYLFQGDLLPDPRETIPAGTGVLALLLEHRWAIPLRDTAAEAGAHAIADGWIGRDALMDVQLLPQDA